MGNSSSAVFVQVYALVERVCVETRFSRRSDQSRGGFFRRRGRGRTRANERVFQTSTKHQREHEEEEEKEGKEEEETDCYGKRAFPKRFFTSNRFVKPGLGLAWANCPNSSVFLSREDTDDRGEKSRRRRRRRRADAFRSPFAEAQSCAFRIEKEGIVNDNDDDELEYS